MSKYQALWEYVHNSRAKSLKLTLEEAGSIAGLPIDHSFLRYKKELLDYGYEVEKISLKEQAILFVKVEE